VPRRCVRRGHAARFNEVRQKCDSSLDVALWAKSEPGAFVAIKLVKKIMFPNKCVRRLQRRASRKRLLRRFSVRRQQPEIVFGVLVVVLRPDDVAGPRFFLSKREISLISFLGALRPVQLWAGGTRCPPLWAGRK
jgi:hypothetical protein